ncbi:hypothetical protein AB0M36_16865 [Actinoplanes sp. NPDC051346]|uniref:hypothetical protein n=1 Tax=Actinoplanes sp. NPDC051346 TaxID=3155048 RepID=UPI00342CA16B
MTYPVAPPDDYNGGQKIDVSPSQIYDYCVSLDSTINDINAQMKSISDTWQGLKLGWAGQTETEVDDFNTKWDAAMLEMFGDPKADPKKTQPQGQSALSKIQGLVKAAAHNYARSEDSLCRDFLQFGGGLAGTRDPSGNLPDPLPDHVPTLPFGAERPDGGADDGTRDYQNAPITETNAKK